MPSTSGSGRGKGKEVAIEERSVTAIDYASFSRLHSYSQDISLSVDTAGTISYPSHSYAKEIAASVNSRRGNVGFVHLAKELAVLSTSLPSGIFVRVDESRIDVIKCLIAGPPDTPYAGGLFEFDIFIPLRSSLPRCRGTFADVVLRRVSQCTSSRYIQDHRQRSSSIQPQSLRKRQDVSFAYRNLARSTAGELAAEIVDVVAGPSFDSEYDSRQYVLYPPTRSMLT